MQTERLLLRSFTPGDWRGLYAYLSQPSVVKYEPYDVYSEESAKLEAQRRSGDDRFIAVCLKDTDTLIGNIYFAAQDFDTWELGYVFNKDYQGRGYASEAARAVIADAFAHKNTRRVIAMCNPLNEKSWKLLERLGLRREGHLLKNIYFKKDSSGNPIWLDTYEYGLLKEEWV